MKAWAEFDKTTWEEFIPIIEEKLKGKPVAKNGSLLQKNLEYILRTISDRFESLIYIEPQNVLLYLHNEMIEELPRKVHDSDEEFRLITIIYSDNRSNKQFVNLK